MRTLARWSMVFGAASGVATAVVGIWLYTTVPAFDRFHFSGLALGLFPTLAGLGCVLSSFVTGIRGGPWSAGMALILLGLNAIAGFPCALVIAFGTESLIRVPYLLAVEGATMIASVAASGLILEAGLASGRDPRSRRPGPAVSDARERARSF